MTKHLALSAAIAAGALAVASAASATTIFDLNVDKCTGGCGYSDYGKVYVDQLSANELDIKIVLNAGVFFSTAGAGHDSVSFNVAGSPTVNIGGLPANWSDNGDQAFAYNHEDGFGYFGYVVNRDQTTGQAYDQQTVEFQVTAPGIALTDALDKTGQSYTPNGFFFAVDVATLDAAGAPIATGLVGSGAGVVVPEPAAWTLMLLGFGGLGAALRRRRAVLAA
jgi:hypothetical protein